jgi:hemerythrin
VGGQVRKKAREGEMAVTLSWSDELLVNVPAIDSDHRTLFILMGEIVYLLRHDMDTANKKLAELSLRGKEHAVREEESMRKTKYPLLSEHRYMHKYMMYRLKSLTERMAKSDFMPSKSDFSKFMLSWLGGHIQKWDLKYALYLQGRGQLIWLDRSAGDFRWVNTSSIDSLARQTRSFV